MNPAVEQIRDMIDAIPALAWSCQPDGTTEFHNQTWLDYTGMSREESLGWGWKAANLINQVSLPSTDRLLGALTSFQTALTWPAAQQRIQALLDRGLQQDISFETLWPTVLGTLLGT